MSSWVKAAWLLICTVSLLSTLMQKIDNKINFYAEKHCWLGLLYISYDIWSNCILIGIVTVAKAKVLYNELLRPLRWLKIQVTVGSVPSLQSMSIIPFDGFEILIESILLLHFFNCHSIWARIPFLKMQATKDRKFLIDCSLPVLVKNELLGASFMHQLFLNFSASSHVQHLGCML